MSEPTPHATSTSEVLLARIEVKLDNALEAQKEHKATLERHSLTLNDHGNRLTVLETLDQADDTQKSRSYSAKAIVWAALVACCTAVSVTVAVVNAVRGGG